MAQGHSATGIYRGRGDRIARWLLAPVLVVFAVTVFVFFVYFQADQVSGDSMLPDLHNGDRVLVTRGYGTPVRGDVVVFSENDHGTAIRVVKRVIGTAGDTVQVINDVAIVNGAREPSGAIITGDTGSSPLVTVPAGTIYVLGDNRPVSYDSRYTGPVALSTVFGRAILRFSPITRLGWVR